MSLWLSLAYQPDQPRCYEQYLINVIACSVTCFDAEFANDAFHQTPFGQAALK